MHPVAEEHIDEAVGGIYPHAGAREAGMTVNGCGSIVGARAL